MRPRTHALCAAAIAAAAAGLAFGDGLRNVKPGEALPDIALSTIDGGRLDRAGLEGKAVILVFLSARQRSSEEAAASAHAVTRALRNDDLALVFVTADTVEAPYFRGQRDRTGIHQPLGLDFDREVYGALGLIVLPTTVVIDPDWKLAHVISSHKSDYEPVLTAYAEHALDEIDDEQLEERLSTTVFRHNRSEDRIARHRAAARVLWESGLMADAEKELRTALEIDPADVSTQLDLAALLVKTERMADARTIVDAVLAEEPRQRRARLIHGVLLLHAGELDDAAVVLEEALLLNPDPVQTHYYLGLLYERKGDTEKALRHYKESLSRMLEDRPL